MDETSIERILQYPMRQEIVGVHPYSFKSIIKMHVHSTYLSIEIMELGVIVTMRVQIIREGIQRGAALELSYVLGPFRLSSLPFCQHPYCFRVECGGILLELGPCYSTTCTCPNPKESDARLA
jgi:hypothetical protein